MKSCLKEPFPQSFGSVRRGVLASGRYGLDTLKKLLNIGVRQSAV